MRPTYILSFYNRVTAPKSLKDSCHIYDSWAFKDHFSKCQGERHMPKIVCPMHTKHMSQLHGKFLLACANGQIDTLLDMCAHNAQGLTVQS